MKLLVTLVLMTMELALRTVELLITLVLLTVELVLLSANVFASLVLLTVEPLEELLVSLVQLTVVLPVSLDL